MKTQRRNGVWSLLVAIARCQKGEDYTEVSSQLTKGAKVVITGAVIAAAASGAAALANNANAASDTVSGQINAKAGIADNASSEKMSAPFK